MSDRRELTLDDGRVLVVEVDLPRSSQVWIELWEACGNCNTQTWSIDLDRKKAQLIEADDDG